VKKSIWKIIPQNLRRRSLLVAATIFLRALLNFVGIAVLLPVLLLIIERESIASHPLLGEAYEALGFSSYNAFAITLCGAIAALIVVKNLAVVLLYRTERDYIYTLYKSLSERLFVGYHQRGLGFIKRNNSAILSRNVNVVSLQFVAGILKPIASMLSEILLLALIFVALLCYTPSAAIVALLLFLPLALLFYWSIRRRLLNIGERENQAQRTKSRIVSETFRGYADIQISGAFPQMLKQFDDATKEIIAYRKQNDTIAILPQMITEIGLIIGLITLVIISLVGGNQNIAIMFGIFAVAAIRLIPSVRNIMTSWSSIRYNRFAIDTLADIDLESVSTPVPTTERFDLRSSIDLRNLTFTFEDATEPTIDNLSLTIHRGECLGIRGTSGVGKTTLFNLILGLYKADSGTIAIDGERLTDNNIAKWQNSIGYVSQSVFIADLTLGENITLGSHNAIDMERLTKALEMADLADFVASLPEGLDTPIGELGSRLSGGQRQRIGIARALYKGADILLFDEATSSLDTHTEENINNAIRRLSSNSSLTIVVIAHRESSLEYCNRIITL
jgi:ABC-type multidrug transport system fused ATPase/permease subunit